MIRFQTGSGDADGMSDDNTRHILDEYKNHWVKI